MPFLGVGDVGRRLGVSPRVITDAFYKRRLSEEHCPIISGRRLIPDDYIPIIIMVLRRHGIETSEMEAEPVRAAPALSPEVLP